MAGSSSWISSCSLSPPAPQDATWISRLALPAYAAGKQADPYFCLSYSFLPLSMSYAVPDSERATSSVLPLTVSSTLSALSNSPPSATWPLQPFWPVARSICWSWLHLARSLTPLMYATTTLSSADFCGVTAQIFCGKEIGSQAALPSPAP